MKSPSSYIFKITGLAFLFVFGFAAVTAQAQNREKYVISAEAGGINLVSGKVTVEREGLSGRQQLSSTDDLRSGDHVVTGMGGRIEVLLNPGSYLRVDENSEFELADASLDNLLVRLIKGSAVVEATGADGVELAIAVKTPQTEAVIIKGGIYRFNVLPNETTEIIVRKGRIRYGVGLAEELKGGRKVLIGRGLLQVAKVDKKEQDELDLWSKERAEMLASANHRLQRRALMTAFNDYAWNDLYGWRQSSFYGSLGLWVYNSRLGGYCFLPGRSGAWSSPYGHRYGTGVGQTGYAGNNGPQGSGAQPTGNNYPSTGNNSPGGNGSGNPNTAPAPAPAPQPMPSQPSPQPMRDTTGDRAPRKVYTDQGPNR